MHIFQFCFFKEEQCSIFFLPNKQQLSLWKVVYDVSIKTLCNLKKNEIQKHRSTNGKNWEKIFERNLNTYNNTTCFPFMVNAQILPFKIHIYTALIITSSYPPYLRHVIYCSSSGAELLMHSYTPLGEKCHAYM